MDRGARRRPDWTEPHSVHPEIHGIFLGDDKPLYMSAHITEASTSMAPGFSVDAIPEIRSEFPGTQIVVLTMQNEPAYARAGCSPLERWATCSKRRQKQNWASGDTYPNPSLGALVAAEPLPGARVLRAHQIEV